MHRTWLPMRNVLLLCIYGRGKVRDFKFGTSMQIDQKIKIKFIGIIWQPQGWITQSHKVDLHSQAYINKKCKSRS